MGYISAIQSVYEDKISLVIRETQEEPSYIDNDGDVSNPSLTLFSEKRKKLHGKVLFVF